MNGASCQTRNTEDRKPKKIDNPAERVRIKRRLVMASNGRKPTTHHVRPAIHPGLEPGLLFVYISCARERPANSPGTSFSHKNPLYFNPRCLCMTATKAHLLAEVRNNFRFARDQSKVHKGFMSHFCMWCGICACAELDHKLPTTSTCCSQ